MPVVTGNRELPLIDHPGLVFGRNACHEGYRSVFHVLRRIASRRWREIGTVRVDCGRMDFGLVIECECCTGLVTCPIGCPNLDAIRAQLQFTHREQGLPALDNLCEYVDPCQACS